VHYSRILIAVSLVLLVGCGGPKTAEHSSSTKKKKYSYRDRESGVANDDSIEDIIYSELSKRQQSLLKKYRVPGGHYNLSGMKFDIPMTMNDRVSKWVDYFTGPGRNHFSRYLSRSTRFVPTQLRILREQKLPNDIIFLSMIESGFNTHAYSSAAASGLWQFIRSTGRLYGLESDYWIDERRDPEKATLAAARHLRDLYGEFGDWYLAFAAYNAGAGKIRRAIEASGSRNFWEIASTNYIRQETKDYVPKILAAAIVAKSPEKYDFRDIEFQDPIDTEEVSISGPADIGVIGECAGVDSELIRLINPELIRNITPLNRSTYTIHVPRGTRSSFERRFANLEARDRLKNVRYVAERGDTLRSIASANGTSVAGLVAANPQLESRSRIPAGTVVIVPRTFESAPTMMMASSKNRLVDLIADNGDSGEKDKKQSKKKKKQEEIKAYDAQGDGEMKVAWKEDKAPQASAPVAATSEVKVEATDNSHDLPVPVNSNPSAQAGAENSAPVVAANAEAPAQPSNPDEKIAEALNKVDVDSNPTDPSKGAVRVKSSGNDFTLIRSANAADEKKKIISEKVYRVKRGDNLARIAEQEDVTVAQLKEWNPGLKKGLMAGQKVVIHKNGESTVSSVSPKASPSVKAKKGHKIIAYKVRRGDTLSKIAKRYDVSPNQILNINGLGKRSTLQPGAVLKIPSKNTTDEG